jgi:hypothetical protein
MSQDTINLFDPDTGATMEVPIDRVIEPANEIVRLQKQLKEARLIISGKTFNDEVIRLKAENAAALEMVRELRDTGRAIELCIEGSSYAEEKAFEAALAKADSFLKGE